MDSNRECITKSSASNLEPVSSQQDTTLTSQDMDVAEPDSDSPDDTLTSLPTLPLSGGIPRQKRKELSLREKVELINSSDAKSQRTLAHIFKISKTQVGSILRNKSEYLECFQNKNFDDSRKRLRFKDSDQFRKRLDSFLTNWIEQALCEKIHVSGPIVRRKALEYAIKIGFKDFKASNGWLDHFKTRNNIIFTKAPRGSRVKNNKESEDFFKFDRHGKTQDTVKPQILMENKVSERLTLSKVKIENERNQKLEEAVKSDLSQAENSLDKLMELSRDADCKLDKVMNQRTQKSEVLLQKLGEIEKLRSEINLLESEEKQININKAEIRENVLLGEERVINCAKALDFFNLHKDHKT